MSIRQYLLLIILSVITLVSFAAAVHGYRASMEEAQRVFDSELQSFALTLATIPLTQATIEIDGNANVAYQVWQLGQLKVRTSNSPERPIGSFRTGYSERNFSGQRWRIYAHHLPATEKWIFMAQPMNRRFELAENMILTAVTPLVVTLPILALFISMIIKRSLEPLKELTTTLRRKKTDDFSPIDVGTPPAELAPVIATLNRLLARLDSAFVREKRFSSDVAHELRTPLSILKVGIHNLEQESLGENTDLEPLKLGVERMSHVVEQILLLNRTNPDHFSAKFANLELYSLVQGVIAGIYPQIEANDQSIELDGNPVVIEGDSFSLTSLVHNLISNASKYSPENGSIRVSLTADGETVLLHVADNGPGIADADLDRVFDRFYQAASDQHDSLVSGCGLGLAIVKQIAELHNAELTVTNESPLGGLLVQVRFHVRSSEI
jgi:two-component system sensor histidine kinase QseC